MKNLLLIPALAALLCSCCTNSGWTWEKYKMDSHRTGVTIPGANNVAEALGTVAEDGTYTAPNGTVFSGGATPQVASLLINAQPAMASLKEVIGHSTRFMTKDRPESELSNFAVDILREEAARITGRKVDFAVTNFGGIRTDMPEGDVLLDDIRSMFPFDNKIVWLEMDGKALQRLMDEIAEYGPQCISGAKMVIKDHKLVSAEVSGKPIDPKKKYGVATVDFLLDGGDNLHVAYGASKLVTTDAVIGNVIEGYIRRLTAEGKPVEYQTDGRVVEE